jgi:hypothetical protein
MQPSGPYPFSRYGYELEDEGLYPTGIFESKFLHTLVLHDGLVEIVYQCSHQQEHRIFMPLYLPFRFYNVPFDMS